MDRKTNLTIKKRTIPEIMCFLLIVMPFWFGTMIEWMGLPNVLRYTLDVAWLLSLVMLALVQGTEVLKRIRSLLVWVGLFFVYTLISYVFKYQSGWYYLWGARNNFRYYIAFVAFCVFLSAWDVDYYLALFDKLFWVNVAVSLVQYFFLEKKGDYLGGIFGVTQGCNAYSNMFFVIILTKTVVFYLEKKETLSSCALKFIAAIIVSALAELKFFFGEAVVILILATLFTRFSWRKVGFIVGGFAAIFAGAALLVAIFPDFIGFLTLENFVSIGSADSGYTSTGDLNRLTAISVINERFFNSWELQMFGFGLGNCDNAAYEFLTTPFFEKYVWMHYTWLSTAYLYLETGWVGLVFFFGFFILVFCKIMQIEKNGEARIKPYCRIARITAIMCISIAIYNASLRTEAGYMAYFVLAIPFVVSKGQKDSPGHRST